MAEENKLKIARVPQYLSGIGHAGDGVILSDLSMNENRLGPSERAIQAFADASSRLWKYPDGSQGPLKSAIANRYGVRQNQVVCGAGADELITLLTRLFVAAGDEILFPQFSFIMFSLNALRIGATPVIAPAEGFAASVNSLLERITDRTRIVFIANPNNPTGTYLLRNDLKQLIDLVPSHIPVVLDGAYAEYVDDSRYSDGLDLLDEFSNLIVLRSFSKIFGLASLRVGWCCTSATVADRLEGIRGPYNVSGPAQAAAVAAFEDGEHTDMCRDHNRNSRAYLTTVLAKMGLRYESGGGNFVMTVFPDDKVAKRAYLHMRTRGVLTRPLVDYSLPQCIRITIGTPDDNELLVNSLREFCNGG